MTALVFGFYGSDGHPRRVRLEHNDLYIGSDPSCAVVLPGLAAHHCRVFESPHGYYAQDLAGGLTIDGREGSGYLQDGAVVGLAGGPSLRFNLEATPSPPEPVPGPGAPMAEAVPPAAGVRHHPALALLLSLVLPGAGQAYNGQPIKGAFLLLTSVLVIPWLFGLYDAHTVASRMAAAGGRTGPGGLAWVPPHLWLVANMVLTGLVVLTVAGVLS